MGTRGDTAAPSASDAAAPKQGLLPGAAGLVEHLDKPVMVCMRDGRSIVGVLRSFDQYANVVLEQAVERIVVGDSFGDVPQGVFVIRGENVMLLGEIDTARQSELSKTLHQLPPDEIKRAHRAREHDRDAVRRREKYDWPMMDEYL